MTKVSVIVPVYNPPEEYLKICINSIINQTHSDLDIILVDNESTGANPSILKEYASKDSRINLIVFEKNKGFAGAVNAGFDAAKGEYIAIVDSDDWLELNAIELLANKLDYSDLDMTIFCANTFDVSNNKFTNDITYKFLEILPKYENSYFTFNDIKSFILGYPTQAWNKFYRKSFILDNNNYIDEEQGSAGADALFTFYNYVNAKKIGIVRDSLYNYRVGLSGGVVKSLACENSKDFLMSIKLAHKIDNLIISKNLSEELALPFININIAQLILFYNMIHKKNKKAYYTKMRSYFKNLDTTIYKKECLERIEPHYFAFLKRTQKYSYDMQNIIDFCYQYTNTAELKQLKILGLNIYMKKNKFNTKRVSIFGLQIYKKIKTEQNITRKFLGIISLKVARRKTSGGGVANLLFKFFVKHYLVLTKRQSYSPCYCFVK